MSEAGDSVVPGGHGAPWGHPRPRWPGPADAADAAGRDGARPPLIGISAYREQARWSHWDMPAALLPDRYVQSVAAAGAIPVLLPPTAAIEQAIARLDGLVLSGGGDIDPARYGARRDPASGPANPDRDQAELALFRAALEHRLPVLGICRGMQVINVALGGTLHQHLPDVVGHDGHSPGPNRFGHHEVSVEPGSRLASILSDRRVSGIGGSGPSGSGVSPGSTVSPRDNTDLTDHLSVVVPTHHHQAVDRLGTGLTATAWTDDGIIEAAELDPGRHPFAVAVQWHPEAGTDPSLFRALAAAAARREQPVSA